MELQSKIKLVVMLANIRLEWKGLTVTNTLAYDDMELITPLKRFLG